MIPKIIHFIWLGNNQIPKEHQEYIDKCKKLMPDYDIKIWNEENFDFSNCNYAKQAYENKKFGFVADYIRVAVLKEYGGIYLDTDVEVLKRFDDLLNCDFFTCFENDAYVETSCIGSSVNNSLINDIKIFYENRDFKTKNGIDLTPNPFYFTYFLYKNYNLKINAKEQTLKVDDEIFKIYCCDYFAPINFTTKKLVVTDKTYAIHHFANSWQGKKQSKQEKLTLFIYKVFGKKLFAVGTRIYTKHVFNQIDRNIKKQNNYKTNKI